jgi:hypothetical protein
MKTVRCHVFLGCMVLYCFDPSADFVIEGMLAAVSVVGGVVCSYPGPFFFLWGYNQ